MTLGLDPMPPPSQRRPRQPTTGPRVGARRFARATGSPSGRSAAAPHAGPRSKAPPPPRGVRGQQRGRGWVGGGGRAAAGPISHCSGFPPCPAGTPRRALTQRPVKPPSPRDGTASQRRDSGRAGVVVHSPSRKCCSPLLYSTQALNVLLRTAHQCAGARHAVC